MREENHGSWWRDRSPQQLLGIAIIAVLLLCFIVWIASGFIGEPGEGTIRININTASNAELQSLPGIAESRAQLIIAHRPYKTVDDLAKLRGIGPSLTNDLRPFLKTTGHTERIKPAR